MFDGGVAASCSALMIADSAFTFTWRSKRTYRGSCALVSRAKYAVARRRISFSCSSCLLRLRKSRFTASPPPQAERSARSQLNLDSV